jgi:hypothetical protein
MHIARLAWILANSRDLDSHFQLGQEMMQRLNGYFNSPTNRGYRRPCEIIAHCIWIQMRFILSIRNIQKR